MARTSARSIRLWLRIAACLLAPSVTSALTIDNFEEGPFSFSRTTIGSTTQTQSGLSPSNVITTQREVGLTFSSGGPATVSMSLVTGSSNDAALFAIDGTAAAEIVLFYDASASPIDLTAGGTADRFLLTLSGAPVTGLLEVELVVVDVFGVEFELVETAGGAEGAYTGLNYVFQDFWEFLESPGDFSSVTSVQFTFRGSANSLQSYSISDIATGVPEPSTAFLLGLGLIALGVRRRV